MKDTDKIPVEICDIGFKMFSHWAESAEPDLRQFWYKCSLAFWIKGTQHITTIRWPAFDVDIVSFVIPETLPHNEEIDEWPCQQHLWVNPEESIIRNDATQPDGFVQARVTDIIDAFFDGIWTPPWNCQMCRKRMGRLIKPR